MGVYDLWKTVRENRDLSAFSALSNLTRTAIALAALLGAAIAGFVIPKIALAILSGAVGAGCVSLLVWAWISMHRTSKARKNDWNPHIWVKERSTHCVVSSPSEINYTSRLTIKVLRNDVKEFNWRFSWTGDGRVDAEIHNKGFSRRVEELGLENSNALIITFDKPWKRGQVGVIEFELKTSGLNRLQRPYCCLEFLESRLPKKGEIVVEFAKSVAVAAVHKEVFRSPNAIWPQDPPEPAQRDRDGLVRWAFAPKRDHSYSITWACEPVAPNERTDMSQG